MAARSRGIVVNVSTNGMLLKDKAELLGKSGLNFLTISMDGHDGPLLDKVRNRHGLFDRIVDGIKAVRGLPDCKKIFIETRYMINRNNYRHLGDFVEKFDGIVDSIVFKPMYKNINASYNIPDDMAFMPEDEKDFLYNFNKFLSAHKAFDTAYNRQIPIFIFHPERLKGRYLCFAGTFFCGIGENGDIYPCHEMASDNDKLFGSLADVSFIELWRGHRMGKIRDRFRDGNPCDCWMDRFLLNMPLQKILRPGHDKA
jgi:radical SAM protein with 4Fe4S-binding SPASM domain